MNNKKLGTMFEQYVCKVFKDKGYWVHFLSPDRRGAQPFDIIAVKDNYPIAIDCKTCKSHIFSFSRAEDNQIGAFEKWYACGNCKAGFAVLHDDKIYLIDYADLKKAEKVDLNKMEALYVVCGGFQNTCI